MPGLNEPTFRAIAWLVAVGVFAWGMSLVVLQQREIASATVEEVYADRVDTALLNFDVTWVRKRDTSGDLTGMLGGGLGLHPDGVFAAQQDESGEVYFLPAGETELRALGVRLPPNNRSLIPEETPSGKTIESNLLRYNDLAVAREGGAEVLLASYSYYRDEGRCFVNRLASLVLPEGWLNQLESGGDPGFGDWQVVFETKPCLPIVDGGTSFPFVGHQAGGRIATLPDGSVLLTVGDFGFDGTEGRLPPYPQLPDGGYGRVVKLAPVAGAWTAEDIAYGMRNPQGIAVDREGRIWETDHSAMGGDELNLVEPGKNYGWPVVTLGVNYVDEADDDKYWPFNPEVGAHRGFAGPVYAWVPSIAPSSIKYVTGLSPRWDGDLLVGALKYQSLVRLKLDGDHVVVAETVPMQRRVRYAEVGHGRLYVLFDQGELAILTPREMTATYVDIAPLMTQVYDPENPGAVTVVADASILVSRGCVECHSGPNTPKLNGLFGRPIASQPGIEYSPALKAKSGTWTEANLRSFLTDTQAFALGTTMPARSLSEEDIVAIIEALKPRSDR